MCVALIFLNIIRSTTLHKEQDLCSTYICQLFFFYPNENKIEKIKCEAKNTQTKRARKKERIRLEMELQKSGNVT